MRRNIQRSLKIQSQTIVVGGVTRCCGTTHTALMLASYLSQVEERDTAYVEYNSSGQICCLKGERNVQGQREIQVAEQIPRGALSRGATRISRGALSRGASQISRGTKIRGTKDSYRSNLEKCFQYHKVKYYVAHNKDEVRKIQVMAYEGLVIDCGQLPIKDILQWKESASVLIVADASRWKQYVLLDYLEDLSHDERNNITVVLPFGEHEFARKLEKTYCVNAYELPYNQNPFQLTLQTIEQFHKIM